MMDEINIPPDEQSALKAIDAGELQRLIEEAILDDRTTGLRGLPLTRCGSYVAGRLRYFEQALAKHRLAKSLRKREETGDALRRAGWDLAFAVDAMKRRMETEQEEGQFFHIDDAITPPYHFGKRLSVTVSYRWRRTIDERWTWGTIMFTHDVALRPHYAMLGSKRKPSAAKQEQDLQNQLYETWEHLTRSALHSLKDYFREGGDGAKVPKAFEVTVDPYTRGLNNYSTQFWRPQPEPPTSAQGGS